LAAPTGTDRWTSSSGVRSAGERKGAAPPAPAEARGGSGRSHGCGQRGGASFDAGGSTGTWRRTRRRQAGSAQVRKVRVTAFYRRHACSTKDSEYAVVVRRTEKGTPRRTGGVRPVDPARAGDRRTARRKTQGVSRRGTLGRCEAALGPRVWGRGRRGGGRGARVGGAALARSGSNISVCACLTVFFSKFLN
jgi:hypothetical protein